jgi:hypothetical protein
MNRREFIGAAASAMISPIAAQSSRISDIQHIRLHGNRVTYCGHPRQGGLFYFGGGELVVLHNHATVYYKTREDVQHDFYGYHARSVLLLQRSMDSGMTWPGHEEVVVWDESAPLDQREKLVLSALTSPRQKIDLSRPESIVVFPRTFLGPNQYGAPQMLSFAFRSPDKGRTWEKIPTLLLPPPGCYSASPDNTPIVRMPDGTFLFPMRTFGARSSVDLYASTDNGLSWNFRTQITEPHDYPALILLKSGRLQCYSYPLRMCYSDDGGKTWSKAQIITPPQPSPWAADDPVYHEELAHRSPAPLLLRDGRILILFARRLAPKMGIGGILSDDQGRTWTPDFIIRSDANASSKTRINGVSTDYADIGYPLMAQFEDGRIFTSYYFLVDDGNNFGGSRFLAGSYFRVN